MPLRDWSEVMYMPILSLRPAEMRALEELPNKTKDLLLPIVHLRPWTTANELESATGRIAEAYGERPVVVAMGEQELSSGRPVHAQLEALRDPKSGFKQWCSFIDKHDNYIPAIQFSPQSQQEEVQLSRLVELDRGIVVIVERPVFSAIAQLAQRVGSKTSGGEDVCFVVDFGQATHKHLNVANEVKGYVETIRAHAPNAFVSLSASSFPDSFTKITEQSIYERRLFDSLDHDELIYSDRGSARVERQTGGGGQPAPRIDYPLPDEWKFFRSDDLVGFEGYQQQAKRLVKDDVWNSNFRVWGTQMIERTAAGDTSAIGSPQKATAARINLHLQRQTFYAMPDAAEDTDEDWSG
ncbi:MAG: beta family protein [Pseudomonadota bacterium]|nr:beta family protein [Pseudomonadota bacterium]